MGKKSKVYWSDKLLLYTIIKIPTVTWYGHMTGWHINFNTGYSKWNADTGASCHMTACNWNVRARGAFCRLLSRAILEHIVELAVGIDLLFRACGCEAGAAHVTTTEPARVITDLVCESAFVTRFGQTLTVFNRSPSPGSCECNKMWCPMWLRISASFFGLSQRRHGCFISLSGFDASGVKSWITKAGVPKRIISFRTVVLLKLMCQPVMWLDHVIVGIFIVVYSSIDPINTSCLSPPSCLTTDVSVV